MEVKTLNVSYSDITISEFYESYLLNKYDFEQSYQRELVWSLEKKQYLIDSILKKFPIPPIFLRLKLDENTGKSKYEVVDGKQRLNSIIGFIKNEFSLPDNFSDSVFGNELLNGLKFDEIATPEIAGYKSEFWKYKIPVAYIDTSDTSIIDGIFERLNKNGEPLTRQELRNAKYHDTEFLNMIAEFAAMSFWKERLKILEIERKADHEFISELVFMCFEKKILDSNNDILDELYERYILEREGSYPGFKEIFQKITEYIETLSIDYEEYKITGVSHLYAIWCFASQCVENNIMPQDVKQYINDFYVKYVKQSYKEQSPQSDYKKSMSSGTRQKGRRITRVNALIQYYNDNKEQENPLLPQFT